MDVFARGRRVLEIINEAMKNIMTEQEKGFQHSEVRRGEKVRERE